MTITVADMLLYAGALFILFLTPGPVWVALIARALSGGFHAAWPLALGVVVGDVLWPLIAMSLLIPLIGNLILAASIHRAKAFLTSPKALRRTNLTAGSLLICVGLLIPFI